MSIRISFGRSRMEAMSIENSGEVCDGATNDQSNSSVMDHRDDHDKQTTPCLPAWGEQQFQC